MGMNRRLISVAALLSFVVLFAPPGGAACAWTGEGAHGCCSEPSVEPVAEAGSCCGRSTPDAPSPTPSSKNGCDCLHAPTAAAAINVGTPTSPETAPAADLHAGESLVGCAPQRMYRSNGVRSGGGGHDPPIFLSHCAFLT